MELHFISSRTHTDLSKSSELVLFQSRGRASAKLEKVQVPDRGAQQSHPCVETCHLSVSPPGKDEPQPPSESNLTSIIALRVRKDPFHSPNLKVVALQFPRLWIPSLTIFCLRVRTDSPSAFFSPGKIILEENESGKCSCLAFSQSIKEPKIQTSVPSAVESSPQGLSE